jgi:uncharacterized membrane protein YkvA (DUF1232 family)
MHYGQVLSLFDETGLSPENLAQWIDVSNSTYRRWQKAAADEELPEEYRQNVAAAVYKLLSSGKLSYDSERVGNFIEHNIPDYFKAASVQFTGEGELFTKGATHQDKITALLSQLGSNASARSRVDKAKSKIVKFADWGSEWKQRIQLLSRVLVNKNMTLVDRLVAYGALFYLIVPFDLIPDAIPVFGYVDDFGILGFAVAYYAKRFPELSKES